MKRLLRSPLLHFLVGGLVLVGGRAWLLSDATAVPAERRIVVSQAQVDVLRSDYERQTGSVPDSETVRVLVDGYVEEEMLFREALFHGLATDNPAVVNRMREKLAFLGDGHGSQPDDEEVLQRAAELGLAEGDAVLRNMFVRNMRLLMARRADRAPEPGELEHWYAAHEDDFREPSRASWSHVFLSAGRSPDEAEALLARLRLEAPRPDGAVRFGEAFVGGHTFAGMTRVTLAGRFGDELAAAVFEAPPGDWAGPVASRFGLHLVRVSSRSEPRVPRLAEVRDRALLVWRQASRDEHLARELAALRSRYEVVYADPSSAAACPPTGSAGYHDGVTRGRNA